MAGFGEKAIFVWNNEKINKNAAVVTSLLANAGFEAAHLHAVNVWTWKTASRLALVQTLRAAGIQAYGSAGVYGYKPEEEGRLAGELVRDLGLAGFIFDAEGIFDAQPTAAANAITMLRAYKQVTSQPAAWCWWPFYKNPYPPFQSYHPVEVLKAAMRIADVGMPMAYWSWGDTAPDAVRYLNAVWPQWRAVTNKPLVIAGRACVGDGGTARPAAMLAFEARARELGAIGMTWWSMEHALDKVNLPGVWEALGQTMQMGKGGGGVPVVENHYKKTAMGLITKKPGWTNKEFAFIVGEAGESWYKPNPDLKAIEEQAAAEGKPFLALYRFSVDFYIRQQYPMDVDLWPTLAQDEPYQMCIRAIGNRNVKAVIVEVTNEKNHDGKEQDKDWISFASKIFLGRVGDWLARNKPGVPLLLASSNEFIQSKAPNMNIWAHTYASCITQPAQLALLDESFPGRTDKPNYLGNSDGWKFWAHYTFKSNGDRLAIFNGDRAALERWLKVENGQEPEKPGEPEKPPVPTPDPELEKAVKALTDRTAALGQEIQALNGKIEGIGQRLAALESRYQAHTHKITVEKP
jgi:hypothetical protein